MWSDWLVFCDYGFRASALWCPLALPTVLLGFLLPWMWGISLAAPAKRSHCSLPWMRCVPSWPSLLTYLSGSSIRYRISGWKFFENFFFLVMPCDVWDLPWPGIESVPPTVEAWSHNHWITKEILLENFKGIDFWIPTSSCWSCEAVVSWSSVGWASFFQSPTWRLAFFLSILKFHGGFYWWGSIFICYVGWMANHFNMDIHSFQFWQFFL